MAEGQVPRAHRAAAMGLPSARSSRSRPPREAERASSPSQDPALKRQHARSEQVQLREPGVNAPDPVKATLWRQWEAKLDMTLSAERRVRDMRAGQEVHDPEVHYLGTSEFGGPGAPIFRSADGYLSRGDYDRWERSNLGDFR
ncbi:hypothetical protein GCM10023205_35050 [Yinghuangia aomiensis]|uniref:Uncharacterized protein n=1 Tax=Yinghuangia aomiensis TaxID=676205 RepID=A0ABP9HC65_9ACTN